MICHGGFHHPIEFLSAFLCQLGCEDALAVSTNYLKTHGKAMKAFRIREVQRTKVQLHVATLLSQFKAGGSTALSEQSAKSKLSEQSAQSKLSKQC